jgi:hypothetical protein
MIILNKNRRYIGLGIGHVFGKKNKKSFPTLLKKEY